MSAPSLSWTRYWAAGVVVVLSALLALAVLLEAKDVAEVEDALDARQSAGRALLPIVETLEEQIDQAATGFAPGTQEVGLDDPDGPSARAGAQARDTAQPALDNTGGGLIVVARYDPPGPTDVAARRATVVGYAVTPLRLSPALDALEQDRGSLRVLGPLGRVMGAQDEAAALPDDVVSFRLPLDESVAPGWRVEALVPTSPASPAAWLIAAVIMLGGVAVAWFIVRGIRRADADRAESRRRRRSEALAAELASVSQSSLDLAEVLPASFAVLEEALDLDGASLVGADARPTFVWRHAPGDDEPAGPFVAPVPAGGCVDVPLARGGRSLGALRVRPRRELDERDVRMLSGAAETLSSAVANADAYAHQRSLITRMRSLDDLKTVFVATASHELRTPIAAIIGYSNMLTENWDDLDAETGLLYATRVENNAQRLAALVENLLDFSRLEQGVAQSAAKEMLDLGAEVQGLIEAQTDLTPDHELLVGVQPGLQVLGSRLAIERVLTNLVGNAAKYSPAGTTIRVRVEGGGSVARLIVDDEGPGVPEHEREQIFSRFFRGKGDAVTRTQGAGLGLSIVTEFAASMDGEVAILAAPTGGTRFEVNYPLASRGLRQGERVTDEGDSHEPA